MSGLGPYSYSTRFMRIEISWLICTLPCRAIVRSYWSWLEARASYFPWHLENEQESLGKVMFADIVKILFAKVFQEYYLECLSYFSWTFLLTFNDPLWDICYTIWFLKIQYCVIQLSFQSCGNEMPACCLKWKTKQSRTKQQ